MDEPRTNTTKKSFILCQYLFLASYKNIFYTHPLEDFYIVQDDIDASFVFLLQKDFGTIHRPFLEVFLYFLNNIL